MRLALFGGSFNPPHVAHQMAAQYVLETQGVDALWLVPCFKHPFEKHLESYQDRFEMCRLASTALGPRVQVSDIERRLGGESRTLRTVMAIKDERPDCDLALVVGSDLVPEMPTWYGSAELRRLARFIVVERAGVEAGTGAARTDRVAIPAVSSTDIRERIAVGAAVQDMVPVSVLDYIRRRKLYQPGGESR